MITPKTLVLAFAVVVLGFLLLPMLLIVPMSVGTDPYLRFPPRGFTLGWYAEYLSDRDWLAATKLSLEVAILTAITAAALGTLAALALARGQLRGTALLRLFLVAPTVIPGIVVAIAMYFFFAGLNITGTLGAFVAAHTVLAIPFVFLSVSAQIQQLDIDLEAAAFGLGASRLAVLRHITVPLLRPAILIGAAFAFLVSFDEAVVSFFISDVHEKTLPRKIFEDIDFDVSPVLAAVSTLVTLVTVIVLGTILWVRGRQSRRTRARSFILDQLGRKA